MKLAGWVVREDPRVPPGELWFHDGQITVGKIVGIRCPTTWERVWAWLGGLVGAGGAAGPMSQGLEEGCESVRRAAQEHQPPGPPPAAPFRDPHRW